MRATVRLATAAAGVLLVAGCAGAGTSNKGTTGTSGGAGGAAAGVVHGGPGVAAPLPPERAPSAAGGAAGPGSGASDRGVPAAADLHLTTAALQDRDVVYTADITVSAKDVEGAADKAKAIVTGAGGVVFGESSDLAGRDGGAVTLTFKVPPDSYDAVVRRLSHEVGRTLDVQQKADDVTSQIVDVQARLSAERASVARMEALMTRAQTVGEVVQVEGQLTQRQAALDSLERQLASLQKQVELSTVTLHLQTQSAPVPPPKPKPARTGFVGGLLAGWDAFLHVGRGLLQAVGAVLPFLLLLVPVAAAVFWLRRVRRGPRPAPPGPA